MIEEVKFVIEVAKQIMDDSMWTAHEFDVNELGSVELQAEVIKTALAFQNMFDESYKESFEAMKNDQRIKELREKPVDELEDLEKSESDAKWLMNTVLSNEPKNINIADGTYYDEDKHEVLNIKHCRTVEEMSYVINRGPDDVTDEFYTSYIQGYDKTIVWHIKYAAKTDKLSEEILVHEIVHWQFGEPKDIDLKDIANKTLEGKIRKEDL